MCTSSLRTTETQFIPLSSTFQKESKMPLEVNGMQNQNIEQRKKFCERLHLGDYLHYLYVVEYYAEC